MEMGHIVIFDRDKEKGIDIDYIERNGVMHVISDEIHAGDL